jgi:hypothetical protein
MTQAGVKKALPPPAAVPATATPDVAGAVMIKEVAAVVAVIVFIPSWVGIAGGTDSHWYRLSPWCYPVYCTSRTCRISRAGSISRT